MPLICLALGAYIVGLFAGFTASPALLILGVIIALGVGWHRGQATLVGLLVLVPAGFGMALAADRDDQNCVNRTRQSTTLHVIIADAVEPGGFTRARVADCEGTVALSVLHGRAEAGATVIAHGSVLRSQRGLLMDHATISQVARPGMLARMRSAIGRNLDATFRQDAPLVRALLIADRAPPELRDRFATAGLAHILSISGMHVGLIAMALALAFELAGVPRQHGAIASIVMIVFYVAMIGAPVAAIRSAIMLCVALATRIGQRPTSQWAIVAVGAGHAVIDPRVVLDIGYQLSVVGVASIIAAGVLTRRLKLHDLPALPKWLAVSLVGTIIATIGSAPIVAWVFGRVSLVAPLSNLAAAPIIELAQPMLFVGMILAPVPPLARFVADAAHPLLVAFDQVAVVAASVPFASVAVTPSVFSAVVVGVMASGVIVAAASKHWESPALVALSALCALLWLPQVGRVGGDVEIHMLDVGQGDAIALRTPNGHWILFDAGGAWRGGDAGSSVVVPYVGHRGGPVDLFVLSHPHTDHVGGARAVLDALRPPTFVDAGFPGPAEAYRRALDAARADHVHWARAHPGDAFAIDGVRLTILAPDSTWTAALDDPNLASVVVLAQYGDVRMLFMGDAERPEEEWLLAHAGDALHADILKVGHHGSKTSSSEAFLNAVKPKVALVSVGTGNVYHLPTPAIMARLDSIGALVLRTDHYGTIIARTDGHAIHVVVDGATWDVSDSSSMRPSLQSGQSAGRSSDDR